MRHRRGREQGFSLLECMISLLLGSVVLGALMAGLTQFQRLAEALQSLGERDRDHQLALVLLARWVLPAGNGLDVPPSVTASGPELEVRADLEGDGGFPDGDLDDSFESITVRAAGGSLQLRSGRGRFEPFARHVGDAAFRVDPRTVQAEITSRIGTAQFQAARVPLSSRFVFARMSEKPSLFPRTP